MALTLGIIGFSKSGKTTIFNTLTGSNAETSAYGVASQTPNLGTVKVPDKRLDVLSEMFVPKKTTPATVEYTDVAGMNPGAVQQGNPLPGLTYIQKMDALVHVVRAFDDDNIPHPEGSINPIRDLQTMDLELIFSDLAIVEKRLIRLEESIKKMRGPEQEAQMFERDVLAKLNTALADETPIRDVDLDEDELKAIRGYQFLSLKPLLSILNLGEERADQAESLLAEARAAVGKHRFTGVEALRGKIEMEISQLEPDEAAEFLADLGIAESGLGKIIRVSYDLLNLMSFLTAGADEVRAWTIKKGTTALKAASEIHTDIERGFIRAEIVGYDDLVKSGSLGEAKKLGLFRSEGKTYVMQDGDIVNFLFNVSGNKK